MNVLAISSSVVLGHVGNSGAAFTLQRLGHEAWPIDTVVLSNHPAHGGFRGRVTPAAEIADLVQGLGERGVLATCDAVLTGYLGVAEQGPAVLAAVAAVRAANPRAVWLLDPIIGDGRVYVKPGIAELWRDQAAADADILTPNAFELGFLSGRAVHSTTTALAAVDALRAASRRRPLVVATGLELGDLADGTLAMIAADDAGAWRVAVPRLDHPAHGAGDIFAAVLLARRLGGDDTPAALAYAAAAVQAVIAQSDPRAADLALIAAQDALARPPSGTRAEALR
jgi:pyridoxine kinase